jgi:hypothetical protein
VRVCAAKGQIIGWTKGQKKFTAESTGGCSADAKITTLSGGGVTDYDFWSLAMLFAAFGFRAFADGFHALGV